MAITESASPSRWSARPIAIWCLRILLGVLFVFAAFVKLSGQPMMVAEFGQVGLGQWLRYLTAILELGGAALLVAPATSIYGAGVLLLVDIGAFLAQLTRIHSDWIHTIVIGGLLALVIALQRLSRPAV